MTAVNRPLVQKTRTKTIATVGPACASIELLKRMLIEGVDVFRLNMAHGNREFHQQAINDIRQATRETSLPAGVLVDLAGPKIRLGQLHNDPLQLDEGSMVDFVRGVDSPEPRQITCSYEPLLDEISAGDQIIINDGLIRLVAEEKLNDRVACRVVDGGLIRSRQGVNLPGVKLSVTALSEVDKANARWAAENGIDFVSLSFVRRSAEILELKHWLAQHGSQAAVIAKIEKREALDQLEEIIESADGVMVARGDLGVEIEIEKTPLAQKRIIKMCQGRGKPVIVATQMLESMHHHRQPTRAEVSDVANAILDGADACMLSGETAIGEFPIRTVATMTKIKFETEQALIGRPSRLVDPELIRQQGVSEAVIFGAAQIASRVNAKMVVIATSLGRAALVKSKQRDFIPTLAVTDQPNVLNRMCLYWGITPYFMNSLQGHLLRDWVNQQAKQTEWLQPGDRVVFVLDTEAWPGINDTVHVIAIE